ncbi:MAG TPA: hypothetical protein VMW16_01490 [Sedimentisphaerales bacterium]|nr:hypothetical protein [Sedimentisphaerales bacterium]
MARYTYLSLIPESLVLSMLPPEHFGAYLATGTKKRAREHAIYFNLKADFESAYFQFKKAAEHCTPHPDGQPKHSVYVSTYRALEHVPLDTIGSLWLATRDGRVLELKQTPLPSEFTGRYHLYQELCPVHPLIASALSPVEFCNFITDPLRSISVPKMCFLELQLGGIADDPESTQTENLPYRNIQHLRDCVRELAYKGKTTKTVDRIHPQHVPYRVIKGGFFVGDQNAILYYQFPSEAEMEKIHHQWWRSAALS